MNAKQAKKLRKMHRKIAKVSVTDDVRKQFYQLAHLRDWFFVFLMVSVAGNIALGIMLYLHW